ncbi:MAG: glutathione binding-like protein [Gammaproteobacteria bacterium]|nr:glutathione binding-like protein [Gammaproteobacteria bacterium]
MMSFGMLVDGKWNSHWTEHDSNGNFLRMNTKFSNTINYITENDRGRYYLYVSYGCPWAHRVIMVYELLKLDQFVKLIIVEPHISDDGWYFTGEYPDIRYHMHYLRELYLRSDNQYTGRVTVPVLWDSRDEVIVNNESSDIIKILNSQFNEFSTSHIDLFPVGDYAAINNQITYYYHAINNACYRTGFAKSQHVYELEVRSLFIELEALDCKLSDREYLLNDQLSGVDISLLPALLRFDIAYYGVFKCNLKMLKDFRNIERYKNRLLENPAIMKTFNVGHIKSLYYKIPGLNPNAIIPSGPSDGG